MGFDSKGSEARRQMLRAARYREALGDIQDAAADMAQAAEDLERVIEAGNPSREALVSAKDRLAASRLEYERTAQYLSELFP